MHAPLELRERAVVVDHEVGASALELRRHLRGDHLHGLRLVEPAVFDQALEAQGAIGVDEHDAVDAIRHVPLEQQWDIAHHEAVAAGSRAINQLGPQPLDFGMDDLVKFFELLVVREDDSAQSGAIELAVGGQDRGSPAVDDLVVRDRTVLDRAPSENVGIDDRRTPLRKHLRDGRFSAPNVARESNQEHDGFLQNHAWGGVGNHPAGPKLGEAGRGVNVGTRWKSAENAPEALPRRDVTKPSAALNHSKRTDRRRLTVLPEDTMDEAASNDEFRDLVRRQLELIGEDPDREGLLRTPQRVATSLAWLTRGYEMDVQHVVNGALFDAEGATNMVLVRDIELYSLCEHHLLPFYGRAHIAYIPNGKIVGLSKLPRLVEVFSRRLQVQERLTEQIAGAIDDVLKPQGVGVIIEAYHLCMMMRGVEKQNSKTITSAVRGSFRSDQRTREEFLTLAYMGRALA